MSKLILTYKNNRWEMNSGYENRHIPKDAKFWWDPEKFVWYTTDPIKASKLKNFADDLALSELNGTLFSQIEKSKSAEGTTYKWPQGLNAYPFQNAGIDWSLQNPSTLIADEMGLGKTIQAVGVINQTHAEKVLIICPASLKLNWRNELNRWLTKSLSTLIISSGSIWVDSNIYIINYDILGKFDPEIKSINWDLLILDEVQYLKNTRSQRSQSVFGKWEKNKGCLIQPIRARRKLALTGTPIENRPCELWGIMNYLRPDIFRSWKYFHSRYADMHQTQWGLDISGSSNLEELQLLLRSSGMIRRLKSQVLTDLPPKIRQILEIPENGNIKLIKSEIEAWNKCRNDKVFEESVDDLIEVTENFKDLARVRHQVARAKLPYVKEFLSEINKPCVVFAHHIDVINELFDFLKDRGAVKLTGDTSIEDRLQAVETFQSGKVQFFVGSLRASGVGITLTAASHVVFVESDWVPGRIIQAEDRCHRIGQANSVLIQHLVFNESLDARLLKVIVEKQNTIDKSLDTEIDTYFTSLDEVQEVKTKTFKTKKSKIEESITQEQSDLVLQGLKTLSSRCDGAWTEDGIGFNKFDARLGHKLAEKSILTENEALVARQMIKKYKKQLGEDFVKNLG